MKLKTIFITLGLSILFSCNDAKPKNRETEISKLNSNSFNIFLKKFKVLKLPLTIKPLEIENIESFNSLAKSDLKFISKNVNIDLDKVYAYGILPDTIETYKLIYLFPYEVHVPILATFNKQGKKINEENLSIGDCGSDCGLTCVETVKISKDQAIYSGNSIKSYECDSLGPKENTLRKYVRFKIGNVNSKGKIYLSKVLVKEE